MKNSHRQKSLSINTMNANCPEPNVSTVEAVWIELMAFLAPARAVGKLFLKHIKAKQVLRVVHN
jgi:hypothetical protein